MKRVLDGDDSNRMVVNADDIFPEEVWVMVISKLDFSQDFHAVSQVSSLFQRILSPKRTLNLFPAVFQFFQGHLFLSDLLHCRLVAPLWRHVINFLDFSDGDPDWRYRHRSYHYEFYSSQDIANFMEAMEAHSSSQNPFVSRTVVFADFKLGRNDNNDFWTSVKELLAKFGVHVWHCVFHIKPKLRTPLSGFLKIWRVLSLMPELRSVEVELSRWAGHRREDGFQILEQDLELVLRQMEEVGLPRLSNNLVHFKIPYLPEQMLDTFLNSVCYSQPKEILMLDDLTGLGEEGYDLHVLTKFTRLTSLHLWIPGGSASFLPDLAESPVCWQLTTFHLYDTWISSEFSVTFPKLVKLLNKFQNLQDVLIGLFGNLKYDTNAGGNGAALNLKKLKRLHVGSRGNMKLETLYFLRKLGNSLEKLSVWFDHYCDIVKSREVIQFCGFAHRMHESNIWELFPKLKVVTVISDEGDMEEVFERDENGAVRQRE